MLGPELELQEEDWAVRDVGVQYDHGRSVPPPPFAFCSIYHKQIPEYISVYNQVNIPVFFSELFDIFLCFGAFFPPPIEPLPLYCWPLFHSGQSGPGHCHEGNTAEFCLTLTVAYCITGLCCLATHLILFFIVWM